MTLKARPYNELIAEMPYKVALDEAVAFEKLQKEKQALLERPTQYWAWVVQYGTPGKPDIVHGVYKSEEVAIEAVEYMEHYDKLGYCDRYTPVEGMPGQYKSGDRMVFIHRIKFRCKVGA